MSPKEIAFRLREMATRYEYNGEDAISFQLCDFADEIDGPLKLKPLRPKPGTVVRFANGDLGLVHSEGFSWVAQSSGRLLTETWDNVVGGELPPSVCILADDEVAVKRSQIQALLGEVEND